MNRSIYTVKEAWTEYYEDSFSALNKKVMSWQKAEQKYGASWRPGKHTHFFLRKLPIYKSIEIYKTQNLFTYNDICTKLKKICNEKFNKSLRKLALYLKSKLDIWNEKIVLDSELKFVLK